MLLVHDHGENLVRDILIVFGQDIELAFTVELPAGVAQPGVIEIIVNEGFILGLDLGQIGQAVKVGVVGQGIDDVVVLIHDPEIRDGELAVRTGQGNRDAVHKFDIRHIEREVVAVGILDIHPAVGIGGQGNLLRAFNRDQSLFTLKAGELHLADQIEGAILGIEGIGAFLRGGIQVEAVGNLRVVTEEGQGHRRGLHIAADDGDAAVDVAGIGRGVAGIEIGQFNHGGIRHDHNGITVDIMLLSGGNGKGRAFFIIP